LSVKRILGVTVLEFEGKFVVAIVPIHHENPGKALLSEEAFRDR
jgi:hypothetical protein